MSGNVIYRLICPGPRDGLSSRLADFRLEQLAEVSEAELKQLHGVGPKALEQLRSALSAKGLSFANEKGRKNI
jgi:hypothetical protein